MPTQVQIRLLRVLQEGMIRRIGGTKELPVNVRIIAATHRNLYYENIPLIAQDLTRKISEKLGKLEIHITK